MLLNRALSTGSRCLMSALPVKMPLADQRGPNSTDALEVDPLALDVDPDVEEDVHAVELGLPRARVLLEDLVVRRELHRGERVEVLAALGEDVVPAADEARLVLVVDELERVAGPRLLDLLEELLERHLALGLNDDLLDRPLVPGEVEVPEGAEGHGRRRVRPADPERLVEPPPVPLAQRLGLELGDERVGAEVGAEDVLHVLERGVLAHPARHLARRGDERVERGTELARLDRRPRLLAQLADLRPDARERRPDRLEVAHLVEDGLEPIVADEVEVERLLGAVDEVRLGLELADARLVRVDRAHRRVGPQRALDRLVRLPVGDRLRDPIGDDPILGHDLHLQPRELIDDRRVLPPEDVGERAPFALDLIDVEPIGRKGVALPLERALAGAEERHLRRPALDLALEVLDKGDEADGLGGRRALDRVQLELGPGPRHGRVRLLDRGAELEAEAGEDVALPGVVLGVDLGLHLLVLDRHDAERALRLGRVERRARAPDLAEQLLPVGERIAEPGVDGLGLEVPERLEPEPLGDVVGQLPDLGLDERERSGQRCGVELRELRRQSRRQGCRRTRLA